MKSFFIITLGFSAACSSLVYSAESYLVMEANSARVILASDSEAKRPVASLTKIATAKVVLDWAKVSGSSLSTLAVVPNITLNQGVVNPMGLRPGDKVSLRDAIYSSLLGSDNVAAITLSNYVGSALLAHRRRTGNPQTAFIREMNNLAKGLGMKKTRFTSPHGLDLAGKAGYSTAADMARLSVYAMRDTGFEFYVKQRSRQIYVNRVNGQRQGYTVRNTNMMLGKQGVNGIKTSHSASAGQCVVVNSNRAPLVKKLGGGRSQIHKRDLIVVVLGSTDRFGRASQLTSQGWSNYDQWAAQGFPRSENQREFLVVPSPR